MKISKFVLPYFVTQTYMYPAACCSSILVLYGYWDEEWFEHSVIIAGFLLSRRCQKQSLVLAISLWSEGGVVSLWQFLVNLYTLYIRYKYIHIYVIYIYIYLYIYIYITMALWQLMHLGTWCTIILQLYIMSGSAWVARVKVQRWKRLVFTNAALNSLTCISFGWKNEEVGKAEAKKFGFFHDLFP